MTENRSLPFIPRTTSQVKPGDFWAIPLRRGGWYACGRVLWKGASRVQLAVGLMDWCEPEPPTASSISGRDILAYGIVHIKSVELTGGPILGNCPLENDAGWSRLRDRADFRAGLGEDHWGYLEIESRAHRFFGRHFPASRATATERPPALGEG